MKNNPKVSVIIPTYNRADLLPRAINSVLNQTFKDFELIIVDDGSTDNTKEVVEKFQKEDKRIEYIKHNENKGGNKARNTGIKNSKGEFLAFLDSDDEWLPRKIEKQIEIFKKSTVEKLGFVYCGVLYVENDDKIKEVPNKKGYILKDILATDLICGGGSSNLIKKECFDNCGLFDESEELRKGGAQEFEMWIRIAKSYGFDFSSEILLKYYIHKDSMTKNNKINEKINAINYIMEKHKDLYIKYPRAYSNRLRYNGTLCMIAGDKKLARRYFLKSIKNGFFNWRSYFYFMVSFLGVNIYKKLTIIKAKIKWFLVQSFKYKER